MSNMTTHCFDQSSLPTPCCLFLYLWHSCVAYCQIFSECRRKSQNNVWSNTLTMFPNIFCLSSNLQAALLRECVNSVFTCLKMFALLVKLLSYFAYFSQRINADELSACLIWLKCSGRVSLCDTVSDADTSCKWCHNHALVIPHLLVVLLLLQSSESFRWAGDQTQKVLCSRTISFILFCVLILDETIHDRDTNIALLMNLSLFHGSPPRVFNELSGFWRQRSNN